MHRWCTDICTGKNKQRPIQINIFRLKSWFTDFIKRLHKLALLITWASLPQCFLFLLSLMLPTKFRLSEDASLALQIFGLRVNTHHGKCQRQLQPPQRLLKTGLPHKMGTWTTPFFQRHTLQKTQPGWCGLLQGRGDSQGVEAREWAWGEGNRNTDECWGN